MKRRMDAGMMVGVIALAGAVLVLGSALARATLQASATGPTTIPAVTPVAGNGGGDLPPQGQGPGRPAAVAPTADLISLAVNRAPFDPQRLPPSQRYRLPTDRVVVEEIPAPPEQPEAPNIRVLGLVAGIDGGVAVIQVQSRGSSPQIVTVGEVIGEYRVVSVQQKAVVVAGGGWEHTLALEEGSPEGATAAAARGAREAQELRRVIQNQEAVQQRLEQMLRALREQFGGGQIVQEGNRAVFIGPDGQRREVQINLPGIMGGGRGGAGRIVVPPGTGTTVPPDSRD